ncbi:hypothetical protein LPJ53_003203 [Coemansia erecta]|uniref:EXPERA domain-containing protein n=1 Tax=Coemansia erecta TaxID=147472 RepID=A0A9W7Y1V0_9FUNG|nr:hypothetical protein LPJ53_003203 [Coemansia erecta]
MFLLVAGLLSTATIASLIYRPRLPSGDRLTALWFVLCGSFHCLLELYYVLHFNTIAKETHFAASLLKEYAKSDSRYLAQVPLVLVLEMITVVAIGPMCFWTAWTILQDGCSRHIAQLGVCILHLYSVSLYFGTEFMAAESNCRPEFVYYWVYLIGMNAPWVAVPLYLAIASVKRIYTGMQIAKRVGAAAR